MQSSASVEAFLHGLTKLTKETGVTFGVEMKGHGIGKFPVIVPRHVSPDEAPFQYFEQAGRIAFGLKPEKIRQREHAAE